MFLIVGFLPELCRKKHSYKVFPKNPIPLDQAKNLCQSMNANIVKLTSEEDERCLGEFLTGNPGKPK